MFCFKWMSSLLLVVVITAGATIKTTSAQAVFLWESDSNWAKLPAGRTWGAVTGVYPDPDGEHLWVLDRCGVNTCLGSDLNPIFKFDRQGNLVANIGAGLIAWPHGFYVDDDGYVWVTDGGTGEAGERAAKEGMGHQVLKFNYYTYPFSTS